MLIAYVLVRTRCGTSKEVIDDLRKNYGENLIQSSIVYGWYDVLVELEIPNAEKLSEIMDGLKRNHRNIIHIGTAIERTADCQQSSLCTA